MSYFFSCLQDDNKTIVGFFQKFLLQNDVSHFSFKLSGNTKVTAMVILKGTGNIKIALLNCLELFRDTKSSPCLQIHFHLQAELFVSFLRWE